MASPSITPPASASGSNDSGITGPGAPRALLIMLGLAATVIAVAGMKAVGDIIAPTFLALTLVITIHPLQRWLVKRGVPRVVGAGLCLLILYAVVLGLMTALTLSIAQLAIQMPRYQGKFLNLYFDGLQWLASMGVNEAQLGRLQQNIDLNSFFGAARTLLDRVLGATTIMVFLITVLFFLVVDAMDIPRRLELTAKVQPTFARALDSFATGVRRYWLVSAIFGLIVAVLDVIGLVILGVPLALLWGLLSFITNFIPNVGFVLGLIPPAILALLEGGVSHMLWVIALYSVLNVVIQVIIQPKFTGDAVGVTPAISFLSLAFWTFVLGPLGALLALPMTLFVKTMLVDGDPKAQWVNAFISSNPREAVPVRPRARRVRVGVSSAVGKVLGKKSAAAVADQLADPAPPEPRVEPAKDGTDAVPHRNDARRSQER